MSNHRPSWDNQFAESPSEARERQRRSSSAQNVAAVTPGFKSYTGSRVINGQSLVYVRTTPLSPPRLLDLRLDLGRHSAEFDWGVANAGAAQLALAMLADLLGPNEAKALYMPFRDAVLAPLPASQDWLMSDTVAWMLANRLRATARGEAMESSR